MNELSTKLSAKESRRFAAIREELAIHKDFFWLCFDLLAEVKESKLYRQEYGTFEDFCKLEMGFTRQYANRMIAARNVMTEMGVSEADFGNQSFPKLQLQELAKVAPEERPRVLKKAKAKAKSEGRNPTAKDIEAAAVPIQEDDDDEIEMPVQISAAELAVANAAIGKKIVSAIDAAKKLLRAVEEVPGTELLVSREKSIMRELDSARNSVLVTIPHSVCPRCHGKCCTQCGNMGWVNNVLADQLTA